MSVLSSKGVRKKLQVQLVRLGVFSVWLSLAQVLGQIFGAVDEDDI